MQDSERDDAPSASDGPAPEPAKEPTRRRDDEPPTIPERPFDETDAAWGDHPQHSDDWWHDQRPPHHGG